MSRIEPPLVTVWCCWIRCLQLDLYLEGNQLSQMCCPADQASMVRFHILGGSLFEEGLALLRARFVPVGTSYGVQLDAALAFMMKSFLVAARATCFWRESDD